MAGTVVGETWEKAVQWLRTQPGQEELVRAAYFDDPADAACDRYWRSEEWSAVRQLIGTGPGRALDAGAGRGIASYALARDGFKVAALEPDPSALVGGAAIRAIAVQHRLPIDVIDSVAAPLPFADSSFDVVFARAVLHHIPDLQDAMREFHRVLKPGGTFLAIREHVISREGDLPAFFAVHPLHHRYGGEMAYLPHVYIDAIAGAGLKIRQVFGPLENIVNYAPLTRAQLDAAIAGQLTRGLPVVSQLAELALRTPGVGAALRAAAARFDDRPGRHYSFVASKP
jgi:SAM-dependent methyltransferase